MERPVDIEVEIEMLAKTEVVEQTSANSQFKVASDFGFILGEVVDDGLQGEEITRGVTSTGTDVEDRSPNSVFIVVTLEEVDGADHEVGHQVVVTHGGCINVALNRSGVLFVHETKTIILTLRSTMNVAVDSGVAVSQSDSGFVVDPLTDIGSETEGGLAPFNSSVAVVVAFRNSHTALPPVGGSVSGDEPVLTKLGGQVTDRINMSCSHHGGGQCHKGNDCDKYFLHSFFLYFTFD